MRGTGACVDDTGVTATFGGWTTGGGNTNTPSKPVIGLKPNPGSGGSLGGYVNGKVVNWGSYCTSTATNTIQFRYSTGGATQADSSQTISYDAHTASASVSFATIDTQVNTTQTYTCSYNGSVYYTGTVKVPGWGTAHCTGYEINCQGGQQSLDPDDFALAATPSADDESPSTRGAGTIINPGGTSSLVTQNSYCADQFAKTPRKCHDGEAGFGIAHYVVDAPIVSFQCPAATSLNQYRLNNGGGTAGMPAYNRVYVPNIAGYDVSVSNGSWDPASRTVAMPQPVNSAGTPVYGTDLQLATNGVTTVIYTKPAASLTVHYTKNGIEDTSLQQVFNGYRGDAITTANKALNVPNGYYIDSGTPPLTCNDTSCTLPANTTYPAGHTDYWITCKSTTPKHESWNANLIVHYKDDQGNTLHPDQTKTVTITHDYTVRPDTGAIVTNTDWAYPGNDPKVDYGILTSSRRYLNFTIDNPTIPGYHTNQPTATYTNTDLRIGIVLVDGGNDTKEITITYHRMITSLPFTGGATTAATLAFIGVIIAAVLITITLVLKRRQNHITTN